MHHADEYLNSLADPRVRKILDEIWAMQAQVNPAGESRLKAAMVGRSEPFGVQELVNLCAGGSFAAPPQIGQLLYALVRAMRPTTVLEFGTGHGFSTLHIAAALRHPLNVQGLVLVEHALGHDLQTLLRQVEDDTHAGVDLPHVVRVQALHVRVRLAAEIGPLLALLGQLWDMLKGPLLEGFKIMGAGALEMLSGLLGAFVNLFGYIINLLNGDWAAAWESALALVKSLWDMVQGVLKLTGITSAISAVVDQVSGGKDSTPALAPAAGFATAAAGAGGNSAELNATTNVYVDGSGDPQATGRAVAGQQGRVNSDLVRNMRGAAK